MSEIENAAKLVSDAINGPNWYLISAGGITAVITVVITWLSGYKVAKWSNTDQRLSVETSTACAIHEEVKSIREMIFNLETQASPYSDVNIQCLKDHRILTVYLGLSQNIGLLHAGATPSIVKFYNLIIQLKNSKVLTKPEGPCCFLDRSELSVLRQAADTTIVALRTHYKLTSSDSPQAPPLPWYAKKRRGA